MAVAAAVIARGGATRAVNGDGAAWRSTGERIRSNRRGKGVMLTRLLRGLRAEISLRSSSLALPRIESHAVNVCSVRAGERHVETAGAATIEGCVADEERRLGKRRTGMQV